MEVVLSSPKKELFKGKADSISVPGKEGIMQVLPGHAPILSKLCAGNIVISSESGIKEFKILSGFLEVHDNQITLLVKHG